MDFAGLICSIVRCNRFSIILLLAKIIIVSCENNSHQINHLNNIPWNILLDPNYTSHKYKFSTPNATTHSPSRFTSPSFSNQLTNIRNPPIPHYVPPSLTVESPNVPVTRYTTHLVPQKNSHYPYERPFDPSAVNNRPNNVVFPTNSNMDNYRPVNSHPFNTYVIPPKTKNGLQQQADGKLKKKEPNRKPADYYDTYQDDYMDNYYQDYDYYRDHSKPSSILPAKQFYRPPAETINPTGLLPDSGDFFEKAKDLLRGSSSKHSYPSIPQDYYPSEGPPKYSLEPESYGGHPSYFDQDGGNPNYYTPSAYDYDMNIGDDHYSDSLHYPEKRKGTKYGPLAFALGLLPLGLLLATLVPTVVTIPVTTAVATGKKRKRRNVQFVNPVLEIISRYGVASLEDPECLNRIFCQVVVDGKQKRSSIIQKLYFKIAYVIDENLADSVGLKALLKAVHEEKCSSFNCSLNIQKSEETD